MLCASPPYPESMQGWPDLFWSEALAMWVECLDEATWYTDAEKAVLDLGCFAGAGAHEWWTELPRPPPRH